ncbi:MAG: glycoside hydrolase family 31 protein, partial [Chitinivibrionales bacterium]|nr:glycoside hydrolase family 31 protein [Chitinivibrionales bacterium]
ISKGSQNVFWVPGMPNSGNLQGPLTTLDEVDCYRKCPDALLARSGWFVIDDSGKAVLRDDWVAQGAVDGRKDWYLFGYGNDYKSALRSLAAVSGPVPIPRKQIFGSWYCRWWDYTSGDYRTLVRGYKDHDFPLDIMVMDMGWHRYDAPSGFGWAGNIGWSGWSWNRKLLPDAEALLEEFKQDGIKTVLNIHPHDGIRNHEDCYEDFMKEQGRSSKGRSNLPFLAGDRDYMRAYFKHAHAPLERAGVDFWWVDWQQDSLVPYVSGVPGLKHLPWLNHLYFKHSLQNGQRGMSFSRWGGWGDHRYPIQFSGDCKGCWEMLTFIVPFTAQSGNAGCFYWAHDLGGFWAPKEDPELFARWVQFGLTSACMRLHSFGDTDRRPWKWDKDAEDSMRISFQWRARLMPYIYSTAFQAYNATLPLLRPMYLEYLELEEAYCNPQEYLFGDNILAAPVTTPGTGPKKDALQTVWFPQGAWYDLFTGDKFTGESKQTRSYELARQPLFVRGGTIIPMQPYTARMTTEPLAQLILRCYPGEGDCSSRFDLYEDDGRSQDYLNGKRAITPLLYKQEGRATIITVAPTEGSYSGQLKKRSVTVELFGERVPGSCRVNGKVAQFTYDEREELIKVSVPAVDIREKLKIQISFR